MLLATNTLETTGNMVFDKTIAMEIDSSASGIILDSLIRIYSNPYVAALREYTSNAWDSHQQAGQTRPIEVSLPTALSPVLVIEDFGVGMSREDLHNYGQFGFSTKRGSNDEIGGFGLGSKVGLAFSSQYTVIGIKDGKLNTAIIGRDDDGNPQMGLLEEKDTDKPNGVKVIIPTSEMMKFREALSKNFFLGFAKGAILIDGKPSEYSVHDTKQFTPIGDGLGWRRAKGAQHDLGGVALVQGVRYKIDWNEVSSDFDYQMRTGFLTEVVINLENGSVDIQRSRESLVYSKRTREVLKSKLEQMIGYATKTYAEEIDKAPSLREAYQIRSKAISFGFNAAYTWNGEVIPEWKLTPKDNRNDLLVTVADVTAGGNSISGYMATKQAIRFAQVIEWHADKLYSAGAVTVLVHGATDPKLMRNRTIHTESNGAVQFAVEDAADGVRASQYRFFFTSLDVKKLPKHIVAAFAKVIPATDFMEVVGKVRKANAAQAAATRKALAAAAPAPTELEVRLLTTRDNGGSYIDEVGVSELDQTKSYVLLQAGQDEFTDKARDVLTKRSVYNQYSFLSDMLRYLSSAHNFEFILANKTTKVAQYVGVVPNLRYGHELPKIIEKIAKKLVTSKTELQKRAILDRAAGGVNWVYRFPKAGMADIKNSTTRDWMLALANHEVEESSFLGTVARYGQNIGVNPEVVKIESTAVSPNVLYPLMQHLSGWGTDYDLVADYINMIDARDGRI